MQRCRICSWCCCVNFWGPNFNICGINGNQLLICFFEIQSLATPPGSCPFLRGSNRSVCFCRAACHDIQNCSVHLACCEQVGLVLLTGVSVPVPHDFVQVLLISQVHSRTDSFPETKQLLYENENSWKLMVTLYIWTGQHPYNSS